MKLLVSPSFWRGLVLGSLLGAGLWAVFFYLGFAYVRGAL
jgi:hypothetical protein